jgi:hypothetical protein
VKLARKWLYLVSGALVLVTAPAVTSSPAEGKTLPPAVVVSLDRQEVSTRLGESFEFTSTIANPGSRELSGLVAHLNIVGLSENIYVDPEDWSDERTRHLPAIAPGESAKVSWRVKAVTGGDAAIYLVVLPGNDPATAPEGLAVSPALDVHITERRTINSGGVLWLALGVPALLGIATLVARRRTA